MKISEELGIECISCSFPEYANRIDIQKKIQEFNSSNNVHGILLQLPLPPNLKPFTQEIIENIDPKKDVDGLTNENLSRLFLDESLPYHIACTPSACLHILKSSKIDISGKKCVIVNRSRIVGVPLSTLLVKQGALMTNCSAFSHNLREYIQQSEVILSAVGKHDVVKAEWIKEGSIILDIGINVIENQGEQKIVGDIRFEEVVHKAKLITPVPGGVGPLTVMMLMINVTKSWAQSHGLEFKLALSNMY